MEGGRQQDRLMHSLLIPSTPSSYEAQNPAPHSGQGRKQGPDIRYRAQQPKLVDPRTVIEYRQNYLGLKFSDRLTDVN